MKAGLSAPLPTKLGLSTWKGGNCLWIPGRDDWKEAQATGKAMRPSKPPAADLQTILFPTKGGSISFREVTRAV